ncbi:MAG: NAD(P)-dependent oxidoreductase [Calditrichaeota bacterium]|nr:NAD(P)-dependent oxidoreductase [Calditrichota bacterium]
MSLRANRLAPGQYTRRFAELKPALSRGEQRAESNRCLYCFDAPCTKACPTHIDVPLFIKQIASGNLRGAAHTILEANPLGGSCARVCPVEILCEGACVLNAHEQRPIAIGRLQRVATDAALVEHWPLFTSKPAGELRVAIVGAGPAGLSCAVKLAREGVRVTLFEREEVAGGLMVDGVAAYKVTEEFCRQEMDFLCAHPNIQLAFGHELGRNLELQTLREDYDAVFLAFGVGITEPLGIPGEDAEGVVDALAFINRIRRTPLDSVPVGEKVVVVGMGMTAIDAATQAKRLGAEVVTLVYRRTSEEKPCSDAELELALSDGCRIEWLAAPQEIIATEGQVSALICQRMRLEQDPAGGRARPVPTGETVTLEADMVIRAIGQRPYQRLLDQFGLHHDKGRLQVGANGKTSMPGLFAGGDCVNGGKEVVDAVQAGKLAAVGILEYLGREAARGEA